MDSQQDPPELGSALLRTAQSFGLGVNIESWKDFRDGQLLWKILQDIDPEYFSASLPEETSSTADNWIPRWQNLKYVNRALTAYLRNERGVFPQTVKRIDPDLKAIATDASKNDTSQLLKMVLIAAFFNDASNQRMVQKMMDLGPAAAAPIANWLSQLETAEKQLSDAAEQQVETGSDVDGFASPRRAGAQSPQPLAYDRDPELEREERLLRAQASIRELERQNMDLVTQLEEARGAQRSLEDDLTEAKYRLERGGNLDASSGIVDDLHAKANQDRDYIAQLEQELESAKDITDSYERQLQKLKVEADQQQQLRDELQMMRVERDDLMQKSKANENLKKKILSMQEGEKNAAGIRQDLESAQEQLRMLETYKKRCVALQKANEENMKTLANTEQEIFDQRTTRKRMDHEIKLLAQRWEAAKERSQRDAETIKDLQDRLSEIEAGGGRSMDDMDVLEERPSSNDKASAELRSKVAKLEAENMRLQEAGPAVPESSLSEQQKHQLEALRVRIEKLEQQYLDEYQQRLGLETTLRDRQDDIEQTQPFLHVRDRLDTETKARTEAERRLFDVEAQLADLKTSLKAAESKLAVVDKSKSAAISELKESLESEAELLHDENKRLLQYVKMSGEDLDDQKSLLRHALLNQHALLKEDPEARNKNEFKLVLEELQVARDKPDSSEDVARNLALRIEDGRIAFKEAQAKAAENQANLEDQLLSMESKLRKAEEDAKKGTATPLQANLQREIALMSSAWYDMNNRLQSDATVVQRRSEAPRSFLGRQRRLVSNPGLSVRRM